MYASVKYWVWLADLLPPAAGHRVYAFFQSPTEAFLSDNGRYDLIPGLTRQQRELLCHASLDRAEQIVEECARQGIRVVTWQDADYPERLRSTPTPPLVVYAKGRACHFDDEAAIAIAGTRRASPYGKRMAWDIASELTRMGGLVVTGIVAGCDANAARGALDAGGPLVCVLAGGVDVPYYQTAAGRSLLAEIADKGTLVSLSPPGTPHLGGLFRSRNELMIGLSLGLRGGRTAERHLAGGPSGHGTGTDGVRGACQCGQSHLRWDQRPAAEESGGAHPPRFPRVGGFLRPIPRPAPPSLPAQTPSASSQGRPRPAPQTGAPQGIREDGSGRKKG